MLYKSIVMGDNPCASASSVASGFIVFDGSVLLRIVIAWGSNRAPDFYSHILINVWRRTDDQPQMAPRTQSFVVFSVSSENSVVLSVLCGNIGFLWSAGTVELYILSN